MGNSLRNDAHLAGWAEPGLGKAGRICGIVGTVLMVVFVLFFVAMMLLSVAVSTPSGTQ